MITRTEKSSVEFTANVRWQIWTNNTELCSSQQSFFLSIEQLQAEVNQRIWRAEFLDLRTHLTIQPNLSLFRAFLCDWAYSYDLLTDEAGATAPIANTVPRVMDEKSAGSKRDKGSGAVGVVTQLCTVLICVATKSSLRNPEPGQAGRQTLVYHQRVLV